MSATSTDSQRRRGYWMRTLHQWHWISSAVCLVGLLLFAVTGITLNHAARIEGTPTVVTGSAQLPGPMLKQLQGSNNDPIPDAVARWLQDRTRQTVATGTAEWSETEVYVSMPRAGGDAWLSIDRANGAVEFENTTRGLISYLNDLHKGRNTSTAWNAFIDVLAVGCLVFCISGLFLLVFHARQRRMTWPLVGLGLMVPLILLLLFIH